MYALQDRLLPIYCTFRRMWLSCQVRRQQCHGSVQGSSEKQGSFSRLTEVWWVWEEGNSGWMEQNTDIALPKEEEIWCVGCPRVVIQISKISRSREPLNSSSLRNAMSVGITENWHLSWKSLLSRCLFSCQHIFFPPCSHPGQWMQETSLTMKYDSYCKK